MLNIPDLEKRWLHYKIKSFFPYAISLLFLCIIIGIYYFFNINNNEKTTKGKKEIVIQKKLHKETVTATKVSLKNTTTQIFSPSMSFIDTIKTQKEPLEGPIKHREVKLKPVKRVKHIQKMEIKAKAIQKKQVTTITIMKQNTSKDIQNILHRFQEDKNPALSLFLAKKYYELGNYKQASNYALITNQLNQEIEDSWLIFAKSLVKMGKRKKAIKLLREYINKSHSTNASILLDNILSGEFQ